MLARTLINFANIDRYKMTKYGHRQCLSCKNAGRTRRKSRHPETLPSLQEASDLIYDRIMAGEVVK